MSAVLTHKFRSDDDPRRHVPIVWWGGKSWTMSVYGPHDETHIRDSQSWTECLGYANLWARINRGAGLL